MKKLLHSLLAALMLLCCLSISALAEEDTSAPDTDANTGTEAPAAAEFPTEIHRSGNKFYLYDRSSGKKITGVRGIYEYPSGSGSYYFFLNKKGRIMIGGFTKKSVAYFARQNGTLVTGWVAINNNRYYFSPKTFAAVTGMNKINGKYYYFSASGILQKGFARLTNNKGNTYTYYFDPAKNGARTTGMKKISGKYYYFSKYGRMRYGVWKIRGKKYYFNEKTGIREKGLKTWNGKTYYFSVRNAACITGWKKKNGDWYYFSSAAKTYGQAVTGWLVLSGKHYYFDNDCHLVKGWQTIDGKKYYFNPQKDSVSGKPGVMMTGSATIDGRTYEFNADGSMKEPTGAWNIRVNLSTNITTVYRGTTPVHSMYCSPGAATAKYAGTHYLKDKLRWHELMGPSWGQYCEHITDSILFHSIPYQRAYDPSSMPFSAFNQLGQAVSHGCIRLACIDAYYIYTNCPVGTPVEIGYWGSDPLTPKRYYANGSGWGYDPTDPVYHA